MGERFTSEVNLYFLQKSRYSLPLSFSVPLCLCGLTAVFRWDRLRCKAGLGRGPWAQSGTVVAQASRLMSQRFEAADLNRQR